MRIVLPVILAATLLAVVAAGVFKLHYQRQHPPAYARKPVHQVRGFVSIDDYGNRANLLKLCFREGGSRWEELADHLEQGLHPTTLLVPAAIGALCLVHDDAPLWFALLSIGAYLGTIALVHLAARQLFTKGAEEGALVAAILAAGHLTCVRSAAQLHMDPFCCLWIMATLFGAWRYVEHRRQGTAFALLLLIVTSLFLKVSCLPLLTLVPLFSVLSGKAGRASDHMYAILWFTVAPLAIASAIILITGIGNALLVDIRHLVGEYSFSRSHLVHFALEMVLLGQFAWLLLVRRKEALAKVEPAFYRCLLGGGGSCW